MQTQITFDTQVKIVFKHTILNIIMFLLTYIHTMAGYRSTAHLQDIFVLTVPPI